MAEIYLRDDNFAQNVTSHRKSSEDIKRILYEIRSAIPSDVKEVDKGFIVRFHRDMDVNYVMNNLRYDQLKRRHLTPDLSKYVHQVLS